MSAVHFKMHPKDFPDSAVDMILPPSVGDIDLIPSPRRFHVLWGR